MKSCRDLPRRAGAAVPSPAFHDHPGAGAQARVRPAYRERAKAPAQALIRLMGPPHA